MDDKRNSIISLGKENVTIVCPNQSTFYFCEDSGVFVDKYGNKTVFYRDGNILCSHIAPTYDELYEHWIKTKGENNYESKADC